MFKFKDYIIIGFICLALGWVAVRQFDLRRAVSELVKPAKNEALAIRVSSLVETNQKLGEEVLSLGGKYGNLTETANDSHLAKSQVEEDLELYKVISGKSVVRGEGLEININEKLEKPQLVDFLNALRNIGTEALSFNRQRVIASFSFDNINLAPPYEFRIIGDRGLIRNSLERRGGILEQINVRADIQEKDNVVVPSYVKNK